MKTEHLTSRSQTSLLICPEKGSECWTLEWIITSLPHTQSILCNVCHVTFYIRYLRPLSLPQCTSVSNNTNTVNKQVYVDFEPLQYIQIDTDSITFGI